jgi:hypothetical protein
LLERSGGKWREIPLCEIKGEERERKMEVANPINPFVAILL